MEISTTDLRALVEKRRKRDALKRDFEAADADFKEHQARLHSLMEEDGNKYLRVDLGEGFGEFTFRWHRTPYGRILDMDTAEESFKALGREGELLKRGVEKRRLNELVKDYLERGEELPAGIDFYTTDYIAIGGLNG